MVSTAIKSAPFRPNRVLLLTQIAFSCVLSTCAVAQGSTPLPTYPCQPVAYLFRHAEDVEAKLLPSGITSELTLAGYRHAETYPFMIENFERTKGYCPVTRVYSEYYILPNGNPGTYNPYDTAIPLAADKNTDEDPPTPIVDVPITAPPRSPPHPPPWYLYEYLQSSATPTVHNDVVLIGYLQADMKARLNSGGSVAIYWTSAGMYNFSKEVFGYPILKPPDNTDDPLYKPPRNSVYVAIWDQTYDGEKQAEGARFYTLIQNQARQCFNFNYMAGDEAGVGDRYYCQNGGSLGDTHGTDTPNNAIPEPVLKLVDGKLCQISNITGDSITGTDVNGYCQ